MWCLQPDLNWGCPDYVVGCVPWHSCCFYWVSGGVQWCNWKWQHKMGGLTTVQGEESIFIDRPMFLFSFFFLPQAWVKTIVIFWLKCDFIQLSECANSKNNWMKMHLHTQFHFLPSLYLPAHTQTHPSLIIQALFARGFHYILFASSPPVCRTEICEPGVVWV